MNRRARFSGFSPSLEEALLLCTGVERHCRARPRIRKSTIWLSHAPLQRGLGTSGEALEAAVAPPHRLPGTGSGQLTSGIGRGGRAHLQRFEQRHASGLRLAERRALAHLQIQLIRDQFVSIRDLKTHWGVSLGSLKRTLSSARSSAARASSQLSWPSSPPCIQRCKSCES
jgi:hypothetical protein